MLCQPGGEVTGSECSCSSFPSNVILLGLCDAVGHSLPFLGFHSALLAVDSCWVVFLWGELKLGMTEAAIVITSLLSLSFLESICVACTDSLRTLPTWDLSLSFRIFLNLDCKLCWIPSEIQVSGDFFFFFVSPFSWCQGWNRQISLHSLSAWRFPVYSHTKESILCCLSFMRMLDPHFGLIFATIMLSLMINSLRVNEIWCYYPNSLGALFFPSNMHKVLWNRYHTEPIFGKFWNRCLCGDSFKTIYHSFSVLKW